MPQAALVGLNFPSGIWLKRYFLVLELVGYFCELFSVVVSFTSDSRGHDAPLSVVAHLIHIEVLSVRDALRFSIVANSVIRLIPKAPYAFDGR